MSTSLRKLHLNISTDTTKKRLLTFHALPTVLRMSPAGIAFPREVSCSDFRVLTRELPENRATPMRSKRQTRYIVAVADGYVLRTASVSAVSQEVVRKRRKSRATSATAKKEVVFRRVPAVPEQPERAGTPNSTKLVLS